MTESLLAALPEPPVFVPVPTRLRHDGWTPDRQRRFIAALAVVGTVAGACRAVGVSVRAAYALRRRPGAEGFVVAWTIALQMAVDRQFGAAMDRALHGYTRPIRRGGVVVGQRHCYDRYLLGQVIRRNRDGRLSPPHAPS